MNIALEVSALNSAHKLRGTGIYADYLIKALKKYENHNSYYLFTRKQKLPDNIDLIHYPFFDPFLLTLPLKKTKPTIATVHDLIPIRFPDKFKKGIRGEIKWQIQRLSLLGCRRVITDSLSSKRDVNFFTGYPLDKIDAIYLAPTFLKGKTPTINNSILDKYKIIKPYILYIGDINWNKNVEGIISAFKIISNTNNFKELNLVLGGKAFLDNNLVENQSINRLIDGEGLSSKIIKTGFIEDQDMELIYREADCFVFPSFYEGFGLPPLNAMHYGCPAVISGTSSLKEIAGPSVTVNPNDAVSIAEGIIKILTMSKAENNKYTKALQIWSETYTWQKTAEQTVKSYEKALKSA